MTLQVLDRLKEVSTTSGSGAFTVPGTNVPAGFRPISLLGNGGTHRFLATDFAGNWELFLGTYSTAGTSLARGTPAASSTGGATVNFPTAPTIVGVADATFLLNILISLTNGSSAAPAHSFVADPQSGMWLDSVGVLGLGSSGGLKAYMDTRFSLGQASITMTGLQTSRLQNFGTAATAAAIAHGQFSANAFGPIFTSLKSRGATVGAQGAVSNNDVLWQFRAAADTGDITAGIGVAANIICYADGAASATQTPGRIEFGTCPSGALTPIVCLKLDSAGTMTNGVTINNGNGALSTAQHLLSGTIFTGGTGTTTFPAMLVQPAGTGAVTSWSTSGTVFGINAPNGFSGNFLDFHINGTGSIAKIDSSGNFTGGAMTAGGSILAQANAITMSGNVTKSAWGASGRGFVQSAANWNDATTPSGTLATEYINLFDIPTLSFANTGVTVTNAYNTYFKAPAAGTNATLTNAWALGADNARIGGSSISSTGRFTFANGSVDAGSTPAIAAGVGAGTAPTLSIAGGPTGGRITLTTGTLPTGGATVATVTFATNYPSDSFVVMYPANVNAAALSGLTMVYTASNSSGFVVSVGATGLTAATQYIWNYHVIGK